ncbi:MAG: hypothetical protein ACREBS_06600 [Nitrososphaerales archaeon]
MRVEESTHNGRRNLLPHDPKFASGPFDFPNLSHLGSLGDSFTRWMNVRHGNGPASGAKMSFPFYIELMAAEQYERREIEVLTDMEGKTKSW